MTAAEWIDMFRRIPEAEHTKLVIVLRNGSEICVDLLFQYEPKFLILRGRLGGTIEESRGFLVPYDQMLCLRLDRVVKLDELVAIFGTPEEVAAAESPLVAPSEALTPTMAPTDPAAASRLLLDRIKAARATSARFNSQMNSQQG